jgi:hypothetical protein
VQSQCGDGKAYQVNDQGWLVWVGDGNSWKDGITKNLWQTKLPAALSPWNYPLNFGMPIVDRPLRGQPGDATDHGERRDDQCRPVRRSDAAEQPARRRAE